MKQLTCASVLFLLSTIACGGANAPAAAPANSAEATSQTTTTSQPGTAKSDEAQADAASDEDGQCDGVACIALCEKLSRPGDCTSAGHTLRMGSDVPEDAAKSMKMYSKACDAKDAEGCFWLADYNLTSDTPNGDPAKGWTQMDRACDFGKGEACDRLAKRYEKGDGVTKDHAKSVALLGKGCAAHDYQIWTCNSLRTAAESNDKGAVSIVGGWKKACAAGDQTACDYATRVAPPKVAAKAAAPAKPSTTKKK